MNNVPRHPLKGLNTSVVHHRGICLCLQVLLYDLRSSRPLLVKDHYYNLPIKSLNFHDALDLVLSADSKIIKMWNKNTVRLSVYNLRPGIGFGLCFKTAFVNLDRPTN